MWTVYKHTAPNGKVYIGITGGKVKNRWQNGHGYKKQIFYRAIKKYGWENINHEILFEGLTKKQAGEMEQHLIEKYDCIIPKGYNKSKGGEYGALGVHPSDETRKKLSEAHKGYQPSLETRRKLSESNKGRHVSAETRRKIGESFKRTYHNNPELRKKLSEVRKGIHPSPESCRKNSEAHKGANNWNYGKHQSAETRQKISESLKGRHLSIETRQKISEAEKGVNNYNYGKHLSAETRRKIGEANAKAVICVETGILYSSCTEAAKSIGVVKSAIGNVLHGRRKTAGGYHWKYAEDNH